MLQADDAPDTQVLWQTMGGRGQPVLGWDSEAGRYVVRMDSQRAGVGKHKKEKVRDQRIVSR